MKGIISLIPVVLLILLAPSPAEKKSTALTSGTSFNLGSVNAEITSSPVEAETSPAPFVQETELFSEADLEFEDWMMSSEKFVFINN